MWFDLRYMATRSRFRKCSPRALSGGATWLWVTWTVNRSGPSEFLPKKPAQFLAVGFGERSEGWARRPYLEATERDRLFDYHSCIAGPLAAQIENRHRLALTTSAAAFSWPVRSNWAALKITFPPWI